MEIKIELSEVLENQIKLLARNRARVTHAEQEVAEVQEQIRQLQIVLGERQGERNNALAAALDLETLIAESIMPQVMEMNEVAYQPLEDLFPEGSIVEVVGSLNYANLRPHWLVSGMRGRVDFIDNDNTVHVTFEEDDDYEEDDYFKPEQLKMIERA